MSTNWVQVAAALIVGVGAGTLIIVFAESLTALQRRQMKWMRYPDSMIRRLTPTWARIIGTFFIAVGVFGAVMGLFFADQM